MCHLSYPQLLSCAYSYKYLEVLWLPKRTQLWACFNTEPNRLYRRLRLFPTKLQEYTPPRFSRLSTQYHIDPLLACLLSLATSRRVCDYSGVQSSVTGILRMGDMNIHITWLTHVRTGPKKKNRPLLNTTLIPCLLVCFLSILHERVCDYSGVQSSATGILRMGDMNIHITWLTHVRTGPKKKKSRPESHIVSHSQTRVYNGGSQARRQGGFEGVRANPPFVLQNILYTLL